MLSLFIFIFVDHRIHLQINELEEHEVSQGELEAQKQNIEREKVTKRRPKSLICIHVHVDVYMMPSSIFVPLEYQPLI